MLSNVSGTSQISTKDNRACSNNFGNEVDSQKVIGKIVSLSSSNEGGLKERKSKIFSTRLAIQQLAVLKRN